MYALAILSLHCINLLVETTQTFGLFLPVIQTTHVLGRNKQELRWSFQPDASQSVLTNSWVVEITINIMVILLLLF